MCQDGSSKVGLHGKHTSAAVVVDGIALGGVELAQGWHVCTHACCKLLHRCWAQQEQQ